jgi:hypothetical protein
LHVSASKAYSASETPSVFFTNMRLSRLSAFSLVFTVALSHAGASHKPGSGSCPYASPHTEKTGCPYANSKRSSAIDGIVSSRAEGKQGIFFMNRIAPGTSELYIANADGSNERKLLGNSSNFDYHASFSPDGQRITFTTERNGDGNSVSVYRKMAQSQMAYFECRIFIAFDPTDPTLR